VNFQSLINRTAYGARRLLLFGISAVLCAVLLNGCVHVSGTAGYWHTNKEGETTAKQAGFDTANLVPNYSTPGKITV
jgi:hypothetical protein